MLKIMEDKLPLTLGKFYIRDCLGLHEGKESALCGSTRLPSSMCTFLDRALWPLRRPEIT